MSSNKAPNYDILFSPLTYASRLFPNGCPCAVLEPLSGVENQITLR